MTLTPAIREALDDLRERIVLHNYVECQENCTSLELRHHKDLVAKAELALLSVVAAEEGRKQLQATQNCPDCVYCSVHRQRGDTVV